MPLGHFQGIPDPLTVIVVYGIFLVGILTFLRWILGDVGDFWKWFKNWWRML
jgi:hypothetical protein